MENISNWLGTNWGWVIAVFCVFFEIAPIKLHPISFVLGWLGKKLTFGIKQDIAALKADTDAKLTALEEKCNATEEAVDMQRIAGIRTLVLDFANSCLNHREHTKEEFDHVLDEHKVYAKLVEKHQIQNEVYAEALAYIRRIYRKCLDKHLFLMTPTSHEDDEEDDDD